MSPDSNVKQKILVCIDEVLDTLFHDGRRIIQRYFEKSNNLERNNILKEPELFCKKLSLVLGKKGAKLTELLIVQRLTSSFDLKNKKPDLTLAEAIGMIRAARGESFEKDVQSMQEY